MTLRLEETSWSFEYLADPTELGHAGGNSCHPGPGRPLLHWLDMVREF